MNENIDYSKYIKTAYRNDDKYYFILNVNNNQNDCAIAMCMVLDLNEIPLRTHYEPKQIKYNGLHIEYHPLAEFTETGTYAPASLSLYFAAFDCFVAKLKNQMLSGDFNID